MVAQFISNVVAAFEAVPLGPLHYRALDRDKIDALKVCGGNYEGSVILSMEALEEVHWWKDHIPSAFRDIRTRNISHTVFTDASEVGWGAVCGEFTAQGLWSQGESVLHINVLELLAIFYAINRVLPDNSTHVRVMCDNTTAIAYINNMGGSKSQECNEVALSVWDTCQA